MFFVLIYVCSVGLTSACQPVQERGVPGYAVKAKCETQARHLIEAIKSAESDDPQMQGWPSKPWNMKGYCISPVIDETYLG